MATRQEEIDRVTNRKMLECLTRVAVAQEELVLQASRSTLLLAEIVNKIKEIENV